MNKLKLIQDKWEALERLPETNGIFRSIYYERLKCVRKSVAETLSMKDLLVSPFFVTLRQNHNFGRRLECFSAWNFKTPERLVLSVLSAQVLSYHFVFLSLAHFSDLKDSLIELLSKTF